MVYITFSVRSTVSDISNFEKTPKIPKTAFFHVFRPYDVLNKRSQKIKKCILVHKNFFMLLHYYLALILSIFWVENFFLRFYGISKKKYIVNFEKIAENPKFGWPYFRKKNFFPKKLFLRNFLASDDTIPEIDPGGSGGKRYFFNLEIAKIAKNL